MKNKIILWLSSIVIVFVASYLKTIFSDNYPVSGTIGIDGLKLTYKLDKEGFGDKHKLLLRSDKKDVTASAIIQKDSLIKFDFYDDGIFLITELDRKITGKEFSYYIVITNQNKDYRVPTVGEINFIFYGRISKMLSGMYYLFLFIGIILIVRSGLEFFNKNIMTKKLLILSGVVWLTFVMLINPLYLSYKFEYINHFITPIQKLFPVNHLLILILLIITVILSFNKKFQTKPVSLIFSVIAMMLYLFQP
jgi:hypothetical protein